MTFKVAARTLLHLGAELISSDGVAFYELVKNGLDAGARIVRVDVTVTLPQAAYGLLDEAGPTADVAGTRDALIQMIDPTSPTSAEVAARLAATNEWSELEATLASIRSDIDCITFRDAGSGMTLDELNDVYLTIGTPSRLEARRIFAEGWSANGGQSKARPILGEKGVGRLSAMRLGDCLHVETSKVGEAHWNVLDIDWSRFAADPAEMIDDIPIEPKLGRAKLDAQESGTTIRIGNLSAPWSRERLTEIVAKQFSKLVDPFSSGVRFPFSASYNGSNIEIPRFNRTLFEHAHARVNATFVTEPGPRFSGTLWYVGNKDDPSPNGRSTKFSVDGTHLVSIVGGMLPGELVTPRVLKELGPFELTVYWYNRQRLHGIDSIGNQKAVRDLLSDWSGGVMVFRDGFRVNPYGDPDDDWLDMDRQALARHSFKVNRAQIVGKVDITSVGNPKLIDQTNREGLRDSVEKRVLVRLVKLALEERLLEFLDTIDEERPAIQNLDIRDLQSRAASHDEELDAAVKQLVKEYPAANTKFRIPELVNESRGALQTTMDELVRRAEANETGRAQLVHLAGVGLMVEVLSHELNRATTHTLDTITNAERGDLPSDVARLFAALESQLRSLQKRLRTLDPLSTRGRQVKEWVDLVPWVRDTIDSHRAQFQRHNIRVQFETVPKDGAELKLRVVKGMIVQVFENLISNSVYWLAQERKLNRLFQPQISVVIDSANKQVRFSDNGPGVEPARSELVFRAFHSTKPPGVGNGLGLFISREIAEYHGARLYLDATPSGDGKTLRTFVFNLDPKSQFQLTAEPG